MEYSYKPLTGSGIRVATLQPGSSAGRISISLRHVGVHDEPMYEALSYTWGELKDVCSLECDRGQLTVTRNLYHALLRLRDEHNPRTPWIDAVCIYQDRYRTKCCRNLRFEPLFCEGVGFAHLACRIGKFTLRVFIMEIYQYIAFYLYLTIPPSRRLARSSSQYDHISLLTGQGSQLVSWSPKGL